MISEQKKFNISLDKIEQIEVVRSFSRTYQLEQYNPINCFSSYKATLKGNVTNEDIKLIAKELQDKSEKDVIEQIDSYIKLNTKPF